MKSFDCAILQQLEIEERFTGRNLSISILVEDVEPVLMEKRDFMSNGFVKIIKKNWHFWTIRIPTKGQDPSFFLIVLLK